MNDDTTMTSRLGRVLYWIGVIVAALLLVPAVVMLFGYAGFLRWDPSDDAWILVIATGGAAACAYGLGWAARYVLSGKR